MSGSSNTAIALISSLVSGAIVIGIIILIIKCCRVSKKWRTKNAPREVPNSIQSYTKSQETTTIEMEPVERFLDEILREKPTRYTSDQLKTITNNYSTQLGSGGFGVVYKGKFPNGLDVAVKLLKVAKNKRSEEQFMAEVGTVGRTYHINLVRLFGFCFDNTTKALVYEYMENGSLDKYLFDEKNRLEWTILHKIAVGTAKGIRYMHEECSQKIVHYDIKPANVLLGADFVPKVCDFGLAKYCERTSAGYSSVLNVITGVRGTPGYAAPEQWMGLPVTFKCDVYSFGMLLFEILGRRRNLEFGKTSESQMDWFPKWVWERFEEGEMEKILSSCGIEAEELREKAERMCKVALWCVQHDAVARPTMSGVVRMLEGEMEIVPPVNPFVYLSGSGSDSTPWSVMTGSYSVNTGGTATREGSGFENSSAK